MINALDDLNSRKMGFSEVPLVPGNRGNKPRATMVEEAMYRARTAYTNQTGFKLIMESMCEEREKRRTNE